MNRMYFIHKDFRCSQTNKKFLSVLDGVYLFLKVMLFLPSPNTFGSIISTSSMSVLITFILLSSVEGTGRIGF